MDSDALLTFLTIHRTGGFSSAAAALRRSQPAISRRIALLEEELGLPVFERISGGAVLSAAGQALLPFAESVSATLNGADNAIRTIREETAGPVSLAAVGTLAGSNLTPILKRFAASHPRVDLALATATSAEVSERVRRGAATIGLRYLLDSSPDLACELLGSERQRVACSGDHRLAGKTVKSLAALRDENWFAFPGAYENRETFADNIFAQFQQRGVGTIQWSPVDSLTAQKRLIEAGFGIALLPESAIREEVGSKSLATIVVRDLQAANPVYAVTRRGGYLSPAAAHLMELLRIAPDPFGAGKRAATRASKRRKG